MDTSFNLALDPWIPVFRQSGQNSLVSLQDAFTDNAIADLNTDPWFGTLGRRSCVPASPILLGRFESEASAIAELQTRLGEPVQVALRVEEVPHTRGDGSGGMLLRDLPLSFSARRHGQRMIIVSSH
jgi:hypothetical protein